VVLDVRTLSDVTDYLVIGTADNRRQLRAIRGKLLQDLKKDAPGRVRSEGEEESAWLLLDLIDAVVHLFDPEARDFYDLELLWGDAPKVAWQRKTPSPTAAEE